MKKWITVVAILVLVIGGLVGYIIGQGGNGPEQAWTEPLKTSAPKGDYIKSAEAEGKLEVGKAEVSKEALGMGIFEFDVPVKNISNQTLEYAELAYTVYNKDGTARGEENRVDPTTKIRNLAPGETKTISSKSGIVGVGIFVELSKFEYTLKNLKWSSQTTAPPLAPKEPEKSKKEALPLPKMTPEEVVMKFTDLMKKGKFTEALELCTPRCQKNIESYGGLRWLENDWEKSSIVKIEIVKTEYDEEYGEEKKTARVHVRFFYSGGTSFYDESEPLLVYKINNEWRISWV